MKAFIKGIKEACGGYCLRPLLLQVGKNKDNIYNNKIDFLDFVPGERRDLNPRVAESQSAALPLGYARQFFSS